MVDDPYILSRKIDGSGPPRPDGYTHGFRSLADKLELPHVHVHSLRHFHATYLVRAGIDLITIAKRLRQADTAMISRVYADVLPEADQEAAAALGGLFVLGE